jgi:hypothetical protein
LTHRRSHAGRRRVASGSSVGEMSRPFPVVSMKIAEDPQQQDDRDRNSDQPKQYAFTHGRFSFLSSQ